MRALFLLCYVVYANAQIADLSHGLLVHLGPYDTSIQIGNLTPRYLPMTGEDHLASRNARTLLEDIRRLFKVGFNKLPPLEPYTRSTLPPLPLDNYLALVKGNVHISNLVISGAQQFKQKLLELRLKTGRVDFGFSLPLVNFDADLDANLVLADILPVHLKEHLSLLLTNVKVDGSVHAFPTRIGNNYYYQVVAIHYHLHIDDVAVQLKGSSDKINKLIKDSLLFGVDIIRDLLPASLFSRLVHNVNTYVASLVLQETNNMLLVATSKQVLAYLVPSHVS